MKAVAVFLLLLVAVSANKDLEFCYGDGLEKALSAPQATGTGYFLREAALRSGAVCLDGTPGLYYHEPGTGSGANSWYVHHQGGGWCESVENCYERSLTRLGSTSSFPATMDISGMGGYFSSDPKVNPLMYNWNKVFMVYCDGGSFAGFNTSTTNYENHILHFRGYAILNAVIDDLLDQRGLKRAKEAVISGCSAGGLATYLHTDHWLGRIPTETKVVALPDSGFFMDYEGPPKYHTGMQWVFSQMNASSGVNQDCLTYYSKSAIHEPWKCFFAQYTVPFIRTPIFPLQSRFDAWQIPNILGNKTDVPLINEFGRYLTRSIFNDLLPRHLNGVWLDSCEHHCGGWGPIVIDGENMAGAFQDFFNREDRSVRVWFQDVEYPCEACCHGGIVVSQDDVPVISAQ